MILRLSAEHIELLKRALELAREAQPREAAAFDDLAGLLNEPPEAADAKCRVCGCSQALACAVPCFWAEEGLCSHCARVMELLFEYFFAVRGADAFDGVLMDALRREFERREIAALRDHADSEPLIVVP